MLLTRNLTKAFKKFATVDRYLSDVSQRSPSDHLFDTFGRKHNYLRISLTERCNLRCLYCMPEEGITLSKNSQLLTSSEVKKIADLFVTRLGVSKIRLTGGEPLIRKDIIEIIDHLSQLRQNGLKTIGITTNGLVLDKKCAQLKSAGLDAINISLDTLESSKFELITRRKGWNQVMKSIDTALSCDFDSIKLNCVVIKGLNDNEILDFVELTRHKSLDVRFIEYMPFDGNKWNSEKFVPFREMLATIRQRYPELEQLEPKLNDTSKSYKVKNFCGQIGFITSMSDNFCGTCNRIRITADGNLKVCLFGREEVSIRDAIRSGEDDNQLIGTIRTALNKKRKQHDGVFTIAKSNNRPMILIGRDLTTRQQLRNHSTQSSDFTHLDGQSGRPRMVDIADKPLTSRTARAVARVWVGPQVCQMIQSNQLKKGNALTVAQIAGIMAAKNTSQLIPLCHQILLQNVSIDCVVDEPNEEIVIESTVKTIYQTGVEMEALTGVSVAALTVYDMCKAVNRLIVIKEVKLKEKTGGKEDIISKD